MLRRIARALPYGAALLVGAFAGFAISEYRSHRRLESEIRRLEATQKYHESAIGELAGHVRDMIALTEKQSYLLVRETDLVTKFVNQYDHLITKLEEANGRPAPATKSEIGR